MSRLFRNVPIVYSRASARPQGRPRANTLKVWDLTSGATLRTLEGHTGSVKAVVLTPDERRAISASADCSLKVWDIESGLLLHSLNGHTRSVDTVALTQDGRLAVSGSADHNLKVWELNTAKLIASFRADGPLTACALTPHPVTVIAGDTLGRVHFLRLEGQIAAV
jgi:WD40 repeat protein